MCQALPDAGECVTLDERESHHLRTVLRAQAGEPLILLDGQGGIAAAVIDEATGSKRRSPIVCRIEWTRRLVRPRHRFCLYVAPPRTKQMSQLIRQATELGVWSLRPILTERSVSRPDCTSVAAWEQDACEACKQSGNAFLPSILAPQSLAEALSDSPPPGYIGWVPEEPTATRTIDTVTTEGEVAVWIGPEGGFSEVEVQALLGHGMQPLRVGPWTLRVETAVVAALACLHERLT